MHHDIGIRHASALTSLDVTVDGRPRIVVQTGKQAFAYVLDRTTGDPIWPMPETPVPQTDVPGEWTSPTQPIPSKPPGFDHQGVKESDLIDFTPELRRQAIEALKNSGLRYGVIYTPGSLANAADGTKGTIAMPGLGGGANWWGASADPETGFVYVSSATNPGVIARKNDPLHNLWLRDRVDCHGEVAQPLPTVGAIAATDGRPRFRGCGCLPPYGRITA